MCHVISRESVFYTHDNGASYQKKTCDFFIYGRNQKTKNQNVLIAKLEGFNLTTMMSRPRDRVIIHFPSSRAKNTYIEVEWLITSDLNKRPEHADKEAIRPPLTEPE